MIVVADTAPLNYLIQLDCDGLLPRLYGRVAVPGAVMRELTHDGAPASVRAWLACVPGWIDVHRASFAPDAALARLGPGEREAIQLAQEQSADLLLIDETKGRGIARWRGLKTTGTLGVLLAAGEMRWVDAELAYRRLLAETTFRSSDELEAQFLALARQFR